MARIRTIKPEFWTDKKVAAWPLFTRLLFIGLWSAADDHGRGSAESARLAAELFPYDLSRDSRETLASVSESLARLSEDHRITLYEVDGEVFYQVENWGKHQRVDKPGKSRIPTPCDKFATLSRDSRECLARLSRLEQGTGNREQGTGNESSIEDSCSETGVEPPAPSQPSKGDDVEGGEDEKQDDPTLMIFPCDGWPKSWRLRQSHVDRWAKAYKNLDVLDECTRAHVWIELNPSKRKTANGMPSFLGRWMARAQNNPRPRGQPKTQNESIFADDFDAAAWCKEGGNDGAK